MVKPVDALVPSVRQGGRQHHQLPSRGVRACRPHHRAHQGAGLQGGTGAQSGHAGVVARPHPRKARPGAAHVGEPRLRRAAVHPPRCCRRSPRCAGGSTLYAKISGSRSTAGSRPTTSRKSPAPAPTPSSPARRSSARRTTRATIRRHAAEPLSGKALTNYKRVPVVAEARADLYTPLAVYLKLANTPYSYLLESVVGGERFGRYSFIGLACAERIEATRPLYRFAASCATRAAPTSASKASRPTRSSTRASAQAPPRRTGSGGAALRRRPRRLLRLRGGPPYREERPERETNPIRSARPTCCYSSPTSSR